MTRGFAGSVTRSAYRESWSEERRREEPEEKESPVKRTEKMR